MRCPVERLHSEHTDSAWSREPLDWLHSVASVSLKMSTKLSRRARVAALEQPWGSYGYLAVSHSLADRREWLLDPTERVQSLFPLHHLHAHTPV